MDGFETRSIDEARLRTPSNPSYQHSLLQLLGLESNDIDVALSDMMGYPFAEHLAEYAKTQGIHTGSIGKVAMNPNQSKHLETATFNVYGLSIDLVNLRSEEYASNSRIPTEVVSIDIQQRAQNRQLSICSLLALPCKTRCGAISR